MIKEGDVQHIQSAPQRSVSNDRSPSSNKSKATMESKADLRKRLMETNGTVLFRGLLKDDHEPKTPVQGYAESEADLMTEDLMKIKRI